MSEYDLNDRQKDLLRLIVKSDEEGKSVEPGVILTILGNDQYTLWGCNEELKSLSDLDALCDADLLEKTQNTPSVKYRIKNAAYAAVKNNFIAPSNSNISTIAIGAYVQNMTGGNLQAVGFSYNSDIKQVVNDSELLAKEIDLLASKLLDSIKSDLPSDKLISYIKTIEELKQELNSSKPSQSALKRLFTSLSLLGDVEGAISLSVRTWPYIYPFLAIAAEKIATTF